MVSKQKMQPNDGLMSGLMILKRRIIEGAREAGFQRHLEEEQGITITSFGRGRFETARLHVAFWSGHGMCYRLIDILSSDRLDTPEKIDAKADLFVVAMKRMAARAERDSRTRSAIVAATNEVLAEARTLGHEMEMLGIEPTSTDVFGKSPREDDLPKAFDIRILMPSEEDGKLTRDVFTLDANDPVEFATYLREYTIPELDDLRSRY